MNILFWGIMRFRKGTKVRVRTKPEILSTLDKKKCTDGLVFMPEMFSFCGKCFKVDSIVNRIFIEGNHVAGISDVVILKGARCSGSHHDGCSRMCTILWKKAWLEIVKGRTEFVSPNIVDKDIEKSSQACQGTAAALLEATRPLSVFDLGQYEEDYRCKGQNILDTFGMLSSMIFKRVSWLAVIAGRKALLNNRYKIKQALELKIGDIVEVKSRKEIMKTLDKDSRLSGWLFSEEMWKYCGKRYRIVNKIDSMVNEITGKFNHPKDTYALENVVCDGKAFRDCPRKCYWFWKGDWLRRASDKNV